MLQINHISQNISICTLNGVRYIIPFSTYFIPVEYPSACCVDENVSVDYY